jgi:DNA (cytosine-5)-methyltransferase 1
MFYGRLKDRPLSYFGHQRKAEGVQRVLLASGVRNDESVRRMKVHGARARTHYDSSNGLWWTNPIFWANDREKAAFIERYEVPKSRASQLIQMSGECLCGAMANPGDVRLLQRYYPSMWREIEFYQWFARKVGKHCEWGVTPKAVGGQAQEAQRWKPLCTGCLADIGLAAAGYQSIGGIDNDPQASGCAQANGLPVVCQDILTADPRRFERPDLLWASPPCVTASIANQRTGETHLDRQLAASVRGFIIAMLPPVVVLENVAGYRHYQAYAEIVATLQGHGYHVRGHGYHVRDWLLNAADYGVPQQRRRLIMIAARAFVPQRPPATHKRHADMFSPQWRGWYDAVSDLAPTFPQAQLAPWQRRRLPEWLTESVLIRTQQTEWSESVVPPNDPAMTVTEHHLGRLRAMLFDDQFSSAGGGTGNERGATSTEGDVPAFTITTRDSQRLKAVLLDHADVRSLTLRALARLQSVPDSYQLPDNRRLACSIIGRGVPCLLAQRIGEAVKGGAR